MSRAMARIDPKPEQWTLLNEGLASAFLDVPSLADFVQMQMGKNPWDIISDGGNRQNAIRETLMWAVADEVLDVLLIRARNVKPRNSVLRKAAEALDLAPSSTKLESKVRAGNNTADISVFIRDLSQAELAVCRVEIGGEASGTGFLVGPDLILTCCHVLEEVVAQNVASSEVSCRFDYKKSATAEELQAGVVYPLAGNWLVDTSPVNELDFVLVRLAGKAGDEAVAGQFGAPGRGWLRLAQHAIVASQSLYVIHHLSGGAMKISLGMVDSLGDEKICHAAETEPGSSGSPCFAMDGKVICVHQHGEDLENNSCRKNGAVRLAAILKRPKVAAALAGG
jgi:V8-like Glu-specific endopeptidase